MRDPGYQFLVVTAHDGDSNSVLHHLVNLVLVLGYVVQGAKVVSLPLVAEVNFGRPHE